jgi:hypothetical protein
MRCGQKNGDAVIPRSRVSPSGFRIQRVEVGLEVLCVLKAES